AQFVLHALLLQLLHRLHQAPAGEGHVIDHALHQALLLDPRDDVQDRVRPLAGVGIKPGAREGERRPRAGLEAEVVLVERQRRRQVVGEDGEVVAGGDGHGGFLQLPLVAAWPCRVLSSTVMAVVTKPAMSAALAGMISVLDLVASRPKASMYCCATLRLAA